MPFSDSLELSNDFLGSPFVSLERRSLDLFQERTERLELNAGLLFPRLRHDHQRIKGKPHLPGPTLFPFLDCRQQQSFNHRDRLPSYIFPTIAMQ